jgi:hypothetical protein
MLPGSQSRAAASPRAGRRGLETRPAEPIPPSTHPQLGQQLSAALITTAVCEPLCGSTPIITAAISMLQVLGKAEHGGHA